MPRVSIAPENKEYELKTGEILYDGLDQLGATLPHGCLSGSCGACRVEVLEGNDGLEPASFIEQNTIDAIKEEYSKKYGADRLNGKIVRLSCRAKIKGDVKIRPLE